MDTYQAFGCPAFAGHDETDRGTQHCRIGNGIVRGVGTVAVVSRDTPAGPVAQWLEPAAHNGLVAGSSPAGPTNVFNGFLQRFVGRNFSPPETPPEIISVCSRSVFALCLPPRLSSDRGGDDHRRAAMFRRSFPDSQRPPKDRPRSASAK